MKGSHDNPDERKTTALERIADALSRLRALKEFELGVLTTSGEALDEITIIAGHDHTDLSSGSLLYKKGDPMYSEEQGQLESTR